MNSWPHNWLEIAKHKYPAATVNGVGRFGVASSCGNSGGVFDHIARVTMTDSKSLAEELATGPCGSKCCIRAHQVVDFQPTPVPEIKDDYEDREYERREEKKAERFRARY